MAALFVFLLISGCAERTEDMDTEPYEVDEATTELSGSGNDVLYQISTLDALLQSVYDGILPIEELETHGDFGIGTFDGTGSKRRCLPLTEIITR